MKSWSRASSKVPPPPLPSRSHSGPFFTSDSRASERSLVMAFFPAKYILRSLGTARRGRERGRESPFQTRGRHAIRSRRRLRQSNYTGTRETESPPLQSPTEFVNNSFLSPFSLPPSVFIFYRPRNFQRVEGYRESSEKLTVSAAVAAMAIKPARPPADGGQKRLGWGASRLSINR